MEKFKKYFTIENLGLLLGMIGAILLAFALGELPCGGKEGGGVSGCYNFDGNIIEYPVVYFLSKTKFYTGIIFLWLAFVFQIKPKKNYHKNHT